MHSTNREKIEDCKLHYCWFFFSVISHRDNHQFYKHTIWRQQESKKRNWQIKEKSIIATSWISINENTKQLVEIISYTSSRDKFYSQNFGRWAKGKRRISANIFNTLFPLHYSYIFRYDLFLFKKMGFVHASNQLKKRFCQWIDTRITRYKSLFHYCYTSAVNTKIRKRTRKITQKSIPYEMYTKHTILRGFFLLFSWFLYIYTFPFS